MKKVIASFSGRQNFLISDERWGGLSATNISLRRSKILSTTESSVRKA